MADKRSFEDFDPRSKWQNEEHQRVLQVNVQGFKKENLRVQIKNTGDLTVSGEHPVDETKWIRFHKAFKVPRDCKLDSIHAKLSSGVLHITMKKKGTLRTRQQSQQNVQDRVNDQGYRTNELGEAATTGNAIFSVERATKCLSGLKNSVRLKISGNMARRLGALVGVVLAVTIGTYVAYKFRQSLNFDD